MNRFNLKGLLAGLSAAALILCAGAASAQEVTWHPTTAAGGAAVDPSYWLDDANIRNAGAGGTYNSVTLDPSTVTYYDTSTHPTTSTTVETVNGNQTQIGVTATIGAGGTVSTSTVEPTNGTSTTNTGN